MITVDESATDTPRPSLPDRPSRTWLFDLGVVLAAWVPLVVLVRERALRPGAVDTAAALADGGRALAAAAAGATGVALAVAAVFVFLYLRRAAGLTAAGALGAGALGAVGLALDLGLSRHADIDVLWAFARWPIAIGLGVAVLLTRSRNMRRLTPLAATLAVGGLVVSLLVLPPFDGRAMMLHLPPALVFALTAVLPLDARRRTDTLGALVPAAVPQVYCQIALMADAPGIAHAEALIAAVTVGGAGLINALRVARSRAHVLEQRRDVQRTLERRTVELKTAEVERMVQAARHREAERSRQILATAVETMSLGVTVTDMEGRIIYVNPADANAHGYSVKELLGRDVRVFAAPTDQAPSPIDDSPEPWARERFDITRDGEIFPVRLVSDRVRDERGEAIATVTLCEDIRERLKIRKAIERRDRVLESVAFAAEQFLSDTAWRDSVDEALRRLGAATDADSVELVLASDGGDPLEPGATVSSWSARPGVDTITQSILSRTPEPEASRAPRGPMDSGVLRPLDPPPPASWDPLRRGEVVAGRSAELADGEALVLRGIHSFAVVPVFVDQRFAGYLALGSPSAAREWSNLELEALRTAGRTVSASVQRREALGALAASETKYRELMEGAHDLIQSVAPDGRFLFVNRAWRLALGYDEDELSELRLGDVARPTDGAGDLLRAMREADADTRLEAVFVAKTGEAIAVEGTVTRREEAGEVLEIQGIFRDITERQAVDRMKQEFISTVSHELRTPLTSILASLGLLASGRLASDTERAAQLVTVAHRNGDRLLSLINNLLDLQKLTARKMTFDRRPIDTAALLAEAEQSLEAFAQAENVELVLRPVDPKLTLVGDRDRLIQVLHNLLSNALKFTPPGGTVQLSAERRDDTCVLVVADDGPGIADSFRDRLFDQFTQADPSNTRRSGGSGLGLSIVRGLVDGMGGTIELETKLGEGATFRVVLPRAKSGDTDTVPVLRRSRRPPVGSAG